LLLDKLTNQPPVGAAFESVTVPVLDCPPRIDDGFSVSPAIPAVLTLIVAELETLAYAAVMVAL
jgi:hypothetical protein